MKRPEVIAHRGFSSERPENTMSAVRHAIAAGVDGIEVDVRLTADGVPVCVHDRRTDRLAQERGVVSTMRLDELEALDFGAHREDMADYEDPAVATEVLTLAALLTEATSASRPVRLAIETKHPTRYGGYVEERLVEVLDDFGLARPDDPESSLVRIMSFSLAAVRRVHRLAPALPTVLLMKDLPWRLRRGALPGRVAAAGPSLTALRTNPHYVRRVHESGGQVHVWTVDDAADIEWAVDLGVDALISNRPDRVLEVLADRGFGGSPNGVDNSP
jgi:glycerophosphoryl diester phosphodiesterase